MSFDFGLSFRNTLSYVTDPSYVAAVLFEVWSTVRSLPGQAS
jgi:hypothetical protein